MRPAASTAFARPGLLLRKAWTALLRESRCIFRGEPLFPEVSWPSRFALSPPFEVRAALVVTVAAFLWLYHRAPVPMAGLERTRDLLSARDCAVQGKCVLIGPPSSTLRFSQGAVWIELLTAVALLGGTAVMALNLVTLLLALGVGSVFLVTRRWIGSTLALPSTLLTLGLVSQIRTVDEFVNPSTELFPAALGCGALLIFALTGRFAALTLASIFVAHASNTHTGALCLLPLLLGLAVVAGPLTTVLSAGLFLGAFWVTSAQTLVSDIRESTLDGRLVALGVGVTAVLSALLASRFLRLGRTGRAWVVAAGMLGPFAGFMALRWLPGAVRGGEDWLYFPPVVAPIAVASMALLTMGLKRLSRESQALSLVAPMIPIAVGAMCLGAVSPTPPKPRSYQNAWRIEQHLEHRGWNYTRMLKGIQTGGLHYLQLGLMVFAPQDGASGTAFDPRQQVRVWEEARGPGERSPAGAEVIAVGDGTRLVFSEIDSWLDPWQADVCIRRLGAQEAAACDRVAPSPDNAIHPFSFSNRLFMGDAFPPVNNGERCVVSYRIPVHPTPGGRRWLTVQEGWSFARVEGLDADRQLPDSHLQLTSRDGSAGSVTVELLADGSHRPCPGAVEYPGIFEAGPSDPDWLHGPFLRNY